MLLLGIAINKLRIAIVPWVVRGPQSIEHVSWYCPHYQHKRAVLQPLMSRTRRSKPCFQHATILTEADAELSDNIVVIQTTLVDIWHRLYSCLSHGEIPGTDDSTPHNGDAGISNRDVSDGIHKNGHLLLVPLKVASFVGSVGNLCGKFVIEDERSAKSRALRLIFLKRTG